MKVNFIKQLKCFWLLALLATVTLLHSNIASAAVPSITSVTPIAGIPLLNTVVITGTGFNDTASRNNVYFGNIKAVVTSATATSLVVTIPSGAEYGSISIMNLTTRLIGTSNSMFTQTYDNSCFIPGTQSFKTKVDFAINGTGNSDPYSTAVGDIDGDGFPDLLVCTYEAYSPGQGYLYIYRNSGVTNQLSFDAPVLVSVANGGRTVKLADLDGDGKLDIILACSGSGRVSCSRNKSTPGTISIAPVLNKAFHSGALDIAVADFDGDGKLDIAGANYVDNEVEIFRNIITSIPSGGTGAFSGSGTFTNYYVNFPTGGTPVSICAADVDGDGKMDIITSNNTGNSISVLRNISNTDTFIFEPQIEYAAGAGCAQIKTLDINNDGKPDFIVANQGGNSFSFFQNTASIGSLSSSSFNPAVTVSTGASSGPIGVDMGDFDGDGKADIAITNNGLNVVSIFKNTFTTGTISAAAFTAMSTYPLGAGANSYGITVCDIDGDTKPDIITSNIGNDKISIFKNYSMPDTFSIHGTDSVCMGTAITLGSPHCVKSNAYWSLTNGHATISGGTGSLDTSAVVTGVSAGLDTVVCAVVYLYDTNYVKYVVKVLPLSDTGIISGPSNVCVSATISLSETVSGGTWTSSNTLIATVDAAGNVHGVTAGNVIISYTTSSSSCGPLSASHAVTVNALPGAGAITGASGVCTGQSITLTASVSGGTWNNRNPTIANAVPSGTANVLTGLTVGSDTILYISTTPLCGSDTATKVISVVSVGLALPITGLDSVCSGASITLANAASGGTWTSSSSAIATVAPTTGVVTGGTPGTATITYTVAFGCGPVAAYKTVTVKALPNAGAITGLDSVCSGAIITLTDATATPGGTWTSLSTAVATVTNAGVVTGVSSALATTTISYTSSTFSCGSATATHAVTVKPLPNAGAITGLDSVCSGAQITLTNVTATPGGTWSSLSTAIATVSNAGIVTGISTGLATTTISYTVSSFSCGSASATHTITVKALPNAGAITGLDSVCSGAQITLADATATPGGTWSSLSTAVATVTNAGVVTGVSATLATTTISYTSSTFSCGSATATHAVTVKPLPNAGAITGLDSVCSGAQITLTDVTGAVGGTWSSLSTAVATITNAGVVTGVSAALATTTISYTVSSFSCGSASATHAITVKALPNAGAITGLDSVCSGAIITLTDATATPGGTWSSLSTAIATVTNAGVVTGVSATLATTTISYTSSTFSCGSATATHAVTVKPLPNAGAITGLDSVCSGAQITLTDATATPGGTWSSLSTAIATVTNAGVVTGVSATLATTTISYTSSTFSCGSATATHAVTVKPLPNAGAITGLDSVCSGAQITLANATATPGGTWSSLSTAIATVTNAGVVTGVSATLATTTISYTSSTFSCGSATATHTVTVKPLPNAGAITGLDSVCSGAIITLADATATPGGTWSSLSTAIATVNNAGVVTGVSATLATTTISYTSSTFSCGSATATHAITVKALPNAGAITGLDSVCSGAIITLADATATPGGTWSSLSTAIATVTNAGVVTGVSATLATTTISYTSSTFSCGSASATHAVTVKPLPNAGAITGLDSVCSGIQITLADATGSTGGTWSSFSTSIATVSNAGIVTGISTGLATTTISYTVNSFSCGSASATHAVTVKPQPNSGTITGIPNLCPGTTTALTSTSPGGTWTSANPVIATVTSGTGVVGGVVAGSTTISYGVTNSCGTAYSGYGVTVIPFPVAGAISGPTLACPGSTISLSETVSGGVWSSINTLVATVTTPGGIVGGVGPGSTSIRYTVTNFCGSTYTSHPITVNPIVVPSVSIAVSPNDTVCAGTAVTYTPTSINGGLTPTYVWLNYGTPIGTGSTFTYVPANSDAISCVLISSAPCPVPPTDTSGAIDMLVYPVVTPTITIVSTVPGDSITYLGQLVTFYSTITYGGTNPTYQWYLDGVAVSGATSSSFTTSVEYNDTVFCIMTSNLECITSPTDTSNVKIIRLNALGINDNIAMLDDIMLYPNPNTGSFIINGKINSTSNTPVSYQVVDMMGKVVYVNEEIPQGGSIRHEIRVGDNIPPGNYMLRIVKDNDAKVVHFTISN